MKGFSVGFASFYSSPEPSTFRSHSTPPHSIKITDRQYIHTVCLTNTGLAAESIENQQTGRFMALKKPPAPPGALRGDPPNQVLPYLFIGSAANAANRTELISLGITHILNVKESYFASTPSVRSFFYFFSGAFILSRKHRI
jgi:hypothetical protein